MNLHKHDPLPFEISEYKSKRHLLNANELIYLSTALQRVDIEVDHDLIISDFGHEDYTIH